MEKADYQLNEKVNNLLLKHRRTFGWLASEVGMSHEGFRNSLVNHTIKVPVLARVAELLEVDITYFFKDSPKMNSINQKAGGNNFAVQGEKNLASGSGELEYELRLWKQKAEMQEKQIQMLEQQLTMKDEMIQILKNK